MKQMVEQERCRRAGRMCSGDAFTIVSMLRTCLLDETPVSQLLT